MVRQVAGAAGVGLPQGRVVSAADVAAADGPALRLPVGAAGRVRRPRRRTLLAHRRRRRRRPGAPLRQPRRHPRGACRLRYVLLIPFELQ